MRSILRRPFGFAVVAGLVVVALGTSAVIGATVATNGGPVSNVRTKTATDAVYVANTTPTDVAGMSLSVTVVAGQQAMFVITFSAEATCWGSTNYSGCYVRVLLDGSQARPDALIHFDASRVGPVDALWKENSMQWVAGPAGPGAHNIKVQFWTNSPTAHFGIGPRTLTVLRALY